MDEKLRLLEREAQTGDPTAINKLKRARQRAGISIREKYLPNEINEYGDVKTIKEGWVQVPRMQARNAPEKHTIFLRWEGTFRWPQPIKAAVVPQDWWEEKKALRASKEQHAEQRAEELRLAKILKVSSRRLRNRLKAKPKLFKWLQSRLAARETRLKLAEKNRNKLREAENMILREKAQQEKEMRRKAANDASQKAQLSKFSLEMGVSDGEVLHQLQQRLFTRAPIGWEVSRSGSGKTLLIKGGKNNELSTLLGKDLQLANNEVRIYWNQNTILEYLDRTEGKVPKVKGDPPI